MLHTTSSSVFKKAFKKKDKFIQQKALERIRLFRENPFNPILNNHALAGEYKDERSFNVTGNCRILFYYVNKNTVCFSNIGTHAELYE